MADDDVMATMEAAAPAKATQREWIGLAVLALAALAYVMDLTVLHLAVPKLSADLQPSSSQLLWIIDIYGFFVAGALITMGTLGDRIDAAGSCYLCGSFAITSVFAAFSTTPEMLIVSRAALGISGATLAPSTLALIFFMFQDPTERTVAIGVWIGAFSAGSAIGLGPGDGPAPCSFDRGFGPNHATQTPGDSICQAPRWPSPPCWP